MLLALRSGALGVVIALAAIRVLTGLLANGREAYTLHAELNWHVLLITLGLSLLCGVLFGLAPAIQSTRRALMLTLKDTRNGQHAPGRVTPCPTADGHVGSDASPNCRADRSSDT